MENVHERDNISCFKIMCSTALLRMCLRLCSFVGIFFYFFLPLSSASISLAYTIFSAYLTFLSKTKINENFSFGEIEADEISLRFWVFFRRYLSTEITRIKIIFQIVDGEISQNAEIHLSSFRVLFAVVKCVQTQRTEKQRNSKGQIVLLSSWPSQQKTPASHVANFHRTIVACDIFPTWTQTGYLTNCTQANLYGENYYLTSIHYNASCLVFGWYFKQTRTS